jgi:hypothetical protein
MLLCFLISLVACTLFYLSSSNQIFLASPLYPKIFRPLAWTLLGAAQLLWMHQLDTKAGFFAALTVAMLLLGVVPLCFLGVKR